MIDSPDPDREHQQIIREWLEKADEDFRSASRELQVMENPSYGVICYHAQQCIEKLLKALLIQQKQKFPRIHDLEELAGRVKYCFPELELPQDDLEWLNEKGLGARYPGVPITQAHA
jgi:HEPN domain-containing protein